jgi:hypothetical protein
MRIYDLINEQKQKEPTVELTTEQVYEKRLKEEMTNTQTKTDRNDYVIK